ncbi:MFS transporter [Rhizobium sp. 1399]|uniref:MFS transporter n=1 Tax=Rhizobium sp. 1399 TaxID=2817758 RepID=UPI00286AE647|nr:MFS transporter [Rhizobium sp. 1399]
MAGSGLVIIARATTLSFLAIKLQQSFGLGPAMIGALLGIGPLVGAVAAPFAGSLSDRVGRKTVLTLTYIGTGCEGPFWAIRDGNFVAFDGAAYRVQMENVTLEDIGSHRVSMSSPLPKGNLVTTFSLKHDDTVAIIEGIRPVPDFTPEQWASAYGAQMRQASETLRASPSLVLCPASKS